MSEKVRVYHVKNKVSGDLIALSWEEAVAFLLDECAPEDTDEASDGHEATITSEHWTQEEVRALDEWSP